MATKKAAPPLGEVLKQILVRNAELDAFDDRLLKTIRRVEDSLRKRVSVRISTEVSRDPFGNVEQLVWGKLGGRWMLALLSGAEHASDNNWSCVPLANASREVRSDAFASGHVEALLRSALDQLEDQHRARLLAVQAAQFIEAAFSELPVSSDDTNDGDAENAVDDLPF